MDLRGVWTRELGVRRLWALICGLPPSSRFMSLEGGWDWVSGPWSDERELLASLVETVSVGATESHRYRKPVEVDRPAYLHKLKTLQQAADALSPGDAARALLAAQPSRVVA